MRKVFSSQRATKMTILASFSNFSRSKCQKHFSRHRQYKIIRCYPPVDEEHCKGETPDEEKGCLISFKLTIKTFLKLHKRLKLNCLIYHTSNAHLKVFTFLSPENKMDRVVRHQLELTRNVCLRIVAEHVVPLRNRTLLLKRAALGSRSYPQML